MPHKGHMPTPGQMSGLEGVRSISLDPHTRTVPNGTGYSPKKNHSSATKKIGMDVHPEDARTNIRQPLRVLLQRSR